MDGTLMNALHGNLNRLSEQNWRNLLKYYSTGTLTLQEQAFLRNDLINEQDMLKEQHLHD